jgi:hypothetical protein
VFAAFFVPMLVRDRVFYPHDNSVETGLRAERAAPDRAAPDRSTERFGDMSTEYIPELHEHLASRHAGWLATWNPHNGLGLPLIHYYGLGRAFLGSDVLSWLTQDPFRTWTWLAMLALSGAAAFAFLFLRSIGLHPLACMTGALGISLCPFHAGWETFLQIPWGFCWTFAFLWGFERLLQNFRVARRTDRGHWVWIVFTLHALLLCGYPQHIVWCGYMAAGYVVLRLAKEPESWPTRLRLLGGLTAAGVVALLTVAPVYLDILVDLQRSTRAGAGIDEVMHGLPRLLSAQDVRVFLVQLYDVFWLGDPLGGSYPVKISVVIGHCVTPFFAAAIVLALAGKARGRSLYWLGFGSLALLLAVWTPAFRFGVQHLGLSFSQLSPLMGALMPCAVLAALGVDGILTGSTRPRAAAAAVAALPLLVALLLTAGADLPLDGTRVAAGVAFAAGAVLFAWTAWRPLLVALVVGSVVHYGGAFVFERPRDEVRLDSPLVQRIRELTPHGERFAWVGARCGALLSPDQEELLGLASVHYHTCFPSTALGAWSSALAPPRRHKTGRMTAADPEEESDEPAQPSAYSRRFLRIADERLLTRDILATSGITLLLSTHPLDPDVARPLERIGRVVLSRVVEPVPQQAQVDRWDADEGGVTVRADELLHAALHAVRQETGNDDQLRIDVDPVARESLLFVSQEQHPSWTATSDGRALQTVRVNGLFQGVLLPPDTRKVELRFLPWVRWSFVPQILFALAAVIAVAARLRRTQRRTS